MYLCICDYTQIELLIQPLSTIQNRATVLSGLCFLICFTPFLALSFLTDEEEEEEVQIRGRKRRSAQSEEARRLKERRNQLQQYYKRSKCAADLCVYASAVASAVAVYGL